MELTEQGLTLAAIRRILDLEQKVKALERELHKTAKSKRRRPIQPI